jgi:hypothetical protein
MKISLLSSGSDGDAQPATALAATLHRALPCDAPRRDGLARPAEGYFTPAMECRIHTRSGPSRPDPCRRTFRPIEAFMTVVCYVRNTSTPAVGCA